MARIDVFTTIHKGVRALLFDVTTAAARVEATSDHDVDDLGEHIDRALDMVDQHERVEHSAILPVLEVADAALAKSVALAGEELNAAFRAARRAASALALAASGERCEPGRDLLHRLNDLTLKCLAHLHHEETIVAAVLWGALGDRDLVDLRRRLIEDIQGERWSDWRAILEPVVTEAERQLLFGSSSKPVPR